jgi:hypothetical protein
MPDDFAKKDRKAKAAIYAMIDIRLQREKRERSRAGRK